MSSILPLTREQQALASTCYRMAESMARYHSRRWLAVREEMRSTAYLALCRAARSYRPEAGVKFSTFAYTCIVRALVSRKQHEAIQVRRARECKTLERKSGRAWHVPCQHSRAALTWVENRADVQSILEVVEDARERRALVLYYLRGMTLRQVGKSLGLTGEGVRITLRRAVTRLQQVLR